MEKMKNDIQTNSGKMLDRIMSDRAADIASDPSYHTPPGKPVHTAFLLSDAEVRSVFDDLWASTYRSRTLAGLSNLPAGASSGQQVVQQAREINTHPLPNPSLEGEGTGADSSRGGRGTNPGGRPPFTTPTYPRISESFEARPVNPA
jgi:hypothetical protein